ncbi:MAG: hypothetical protein BM557_09505 [Flavobacterium sp. MedPE-SWcel]|uniref:hypothetical protein n=1 Tax=uncultured Flavobacterium sp. TaxID=165435 RepID=UPI00090F6874|nr:hypothetical protein [uncultured Flavobacterium sp.]OIQ16540.1 MAG: hypothetical protein BM557_09505 [Flavobacterium sp. MedPE-SWcel]
MDTYLIRYDDQEITSIMKISKDIDLVGMHNKHIVTDLTDAIVTFMLRKYDVQILINEFEKPEEEF